MSGHEARAGDKFCGRCGQAVQSSAQSDAASPAWLATSTLQLPSQSEAEYPTGLPPPRQRTRWSRGALTAAVVAGVLVLGAATFGVVAGATGGHGAEGLQSSSRNAIASSPSPSTTTHASTTVPPSTSQPTTAPASSAHAATGPAPALGPLVGNWTGHGGVVQIDADGKGQATFRAYRFCTDDPTPPCDTMAGNTVVAGGHAQLVMTATPDAGVATGIVVSSDDPEAFQPGFAITIRLAPGDDVLFVSSSPAAQNVAYCGSIATPGACGT